MTKKNGNYPIPFDKDGNQQDYPQSWYVATGERAKYRGSEETYAVTRSEGPNWKDNYEFEDVLTPVSVGRGRSSVTFTMKRRDGTTVSVFVSDYFEMSQHMQQGVVAGRFTFCKKGQNYGCKLIKSLPLLEPVHGDLLPPIGSQVLIHLGSLNRWVEHTVIGYYAWGDLGGNPALHRVFVRVRDDAGYENARLLQDVRPVAKETANV